MAGGARPTRVGPFRTRSKATRDSRTMAPRRRPLSECLYLHEVRRTSGRTLVAACRALVKPVSVPRRSKTPRVRPSTCPQPRMAACAV